MQVAWFRFIVKVWTSSGGFFCSGSILLVRPADIDMAQGKCAASWYCGSDCDRQPPSRNPQDIWASLMSTCLNNSWRIPFVPKDSSFMGDYGNILSMSCCVYLDYFGLLCETCVSILARLCLPILPGWLAWLKSGEFLEIYGNVKQLSSKAFNREILCDFMSWWWEEAAAESSEPFQAPLSTFFHPHGHWTLLPTVDLECVPAFFPPWREPTQDLLHLSGHCIIQVITMLCPSEDVV